MIPIFPLLVAPAEAGAQGRPLRPCHSGFPLSRERRISGVSGIFSAACQLRTGLDVVGSRRIAGGAADAAELPFRVLLQPLRSQLLAPQYAPRQSRPAVLHVGPYCLAMIWMTEQTENQRQRDQHNRMDQKFFSLSRLSSRRNHKFVKLCGPRLPTQPLLCSRSALPLSYAPGANRLAGWWARQGLNL
jgi:hypothetical protein